MGEEEGILASDRGAKKWCSCGKYKVLVVRRL